jgi:hypothetical protein
MAKESVGFPAELLNLLDGYVHAQSVNKRSGPPEGGCAGWFANGRQAGTGDGPRQGLRLERQDLWQYAAIRQGDDGQSDKNPREKAGLPEKRPLAAE